MRLYVHPFFGVQIIEEDGTHLLRLDQDLACKILTENDCIRQALRELADEIIRTCNKSAGRIISDTTRKEIEPLRKLAERCLKKL